MALRNCDVDSVIRCLIEGGRENAKIVSESALTKMRALRIAADPDKAVKALQYHAGRRNPDRPLHGHPKGSGDLNMRGVLDWIESIDKSDGNEMLAARLNLVSVQATAAARCASA